MGKFSPDGHSIKLRTANYGDGIVAFTDLRTLTGLLPWDHTFKRTLLLRAFTAPRSVVLRVPSPTCDSTRQRVFTLGRKLLNLRHSHRLSRSAVASGPHRPTARLADPCSNAAQMLDSIGRFAVCSPECSNLRNAGAV